ncbi:MAG: hypothetical protein ACI9W6_002776 [Motiliproteus sp.]|jgi:hypothetical protein
MKGFIIFVTTALLLCATPTIAAENTFDILGKRASESCKERAQDVHAAVTLRDAGKTQQEILAKLKKPSDQWSIDKNYVELLFKFSNTNPEHFKNFAVKSCRVYFWSLVQEELCATIFEPEEKNLCMRTVDRSAKRMITSAYSEIQQ